MMSQSFHYNTSYIIDAISNGKTVFAFPFSNFNSDFLDIYAILPSIKEAMALHTVMLLSEDNYDVEQSIIEQYVLAPIHRAWLNTDAPAGFVTSVASVLLMYALPKSFEQVDGLLNTVRNSRTVFDQFKDLLVTADIHYPLISSTDIYNLIEASIQSEDKLIRMQVLEKPLHLAKPKTKKKANPASMVEQTNVQRPTQSSAGHAIIDTEAENRKLQQALYG